MELLAWDFGDPQYDADGRPRFQIVAQWQPQTRDFQTQLLDSSISGAGLYYVRLQQSGPLVDGLRPAALTSPIWVNRTMETATFLPALASP